jgi:hypothetical protein
MQDVDIIISVYYYYYISGNNLLTIAYTDSICNQFVGYNFEILRRYCICNQCLTNNVSCIIVGTLT